MRGATEYKDLALLERVISIHAPRAGSDNGADYERPLTYDISIHAPRAGSDGLYGGDRQRDDYFNPRSPCGERLRGPQGEQGPTGISIHAPRAGSDGNEMKLVTASFDISIHAPRAGSDI